MKTLLEKYRPINVLLAEDDEDDQYIFSEAIKQLSTEIELLIVNDGLGILNIINTTEHFIPHIIFLDLNMPRMNGLECLKAIRKREIFKNTPCIILSTSTAVEDIDKTYNCKANLYLQKPSDFEDFEKMLNKILEIEWKDYFPPKRELYFITQKSYR